MEHKNFRVYERNNIDFNVVQYGYRKCDPNFGEKPHIWSNFLFHYVHSGKGVLNLDGNKYQVSQGEGFMIFPGQIATYIADSVEPFEYSWIEFYGSGTKAMLRSSSLSPKNPIVPDSEGKIDKAIKDIVETGEMTNAMLMSKFWAFADTLYTHNLNVISPTDMYIEKAVSYIGENIGSDTTVTEICNYLNISRNYFSAIFTEKMGMSPKRYILKQHMDMALELLKRSDYSIGEIANIVGYDKQSKFTKAFIRYMSVSPSAYRKNR